MKTHLFFLAILFSFAFSKVNAQCPSGDVDIINQSQLNSFVAFYPNCTHITGRLWLGEFLSGHNDINDLSGLSNLTKIDGQLGFFGTNLISLNNLNNLQEIGGLNLADNPNLTSIAQLTNITAITGNVQFGMNPQLTSLNGLNNVQSITGYLRLFYDNPNLTSFEALNNLTSVGNYVYILGTNAPSLEGLNNLTSVGEYLNIIGNENLSDIQALENLTSIGGYIIIENNPQLISLQGIHNIDPETILSNGELGLYIGANPILTTCNLPNICEYLSFDPTVNPREIIGNTGNCTDEQAVLAACGLGVNDVENESTNWQVHYKKENNSFLVQSKGFEISDIQVYNLNGQLIKEFNGLNSNQEEISVFSPDNILILKVISSDGKSFAKKVIIK